MITVAALVLIAWVGVTAFYTLYIAAINVYYAWGTLAPWVKVLAGPIVMVMLAGDAAFQLTAATLIFADWPRELMFTQRLTRYKGDKWPEDWRKITATALCTKALNPFDPTRHHC